MTSLRCSLLTLPAGVRRFARLPASERGVALEAAFAVPLVTFGIRLLGYRRAYGALATWARRTRPPAWLTVSRPSPERIAELLTAVAARRIGSDTCLHRALTLWMLLRRRGYEARVVFGVRKRGDVEAHAWVELAGHVLNDASDVATRYAPFERALAD